MITPSDVKVNDDQKVTSFLGMVQKKLFEELNDTQKEDVKKLMDDGWERDQVIGPAKGNLSYEKMKHEMEQ